MSAVAKRYARALYEVAREHDQLTAIEEELHHIEQMLLDHPKLLKFLHHPQIDKSVKKEKFSQIFQDHLSKTMLQFMQLLIEKHRETEIEDVTRYYIKFANRERGLEDAIVTTIKPLSDDEKQSLSDHFGRLINKKIRIHNIVDSDILGGIIVKIGDRLYDGSVVGKLHRFKRRVVTSKS